MPYSQVKLCSFSSFFSETQDPLSSEENTLKILNIIENKIWVFDLSELIVIFQEA